LRFDSEGSHEYVQINTVQWGQEISGSHGCEYEDDCLLVVWCKYVPWQAPLKRIIALMMEAASPSETSVSFHQTTRRNIPEDSHLRVQEFFPTDEWYIRKEHKSIVLSSRIRGFFPPRLLYKFLVYFFVIYLMTLSVAQII
jgi:hypothetical protein